MRIEKIYVAHNILEKINKASLNKRETNEGSAFPILVELVIIFQFVHKEPKRGIFLANVNQKMKKRRFSAVSIAFMF